MPQIDDTDDRADLAYLPEDEANEAAWQGKEHYTGDVAKAAPQEPTPAEPATQQYEPGTEPPDTHGFRPPTVVPSYCQQPDKCRGAIAQAQRTQIAYGRGELLTYHQCSDCHGKSAMTASPLENCGC